MSYDHADDALWLSGQSDHASDERKDSPPKDVIDRMVKHGLSSKISSEHTWPDYMAELYAIAHGKQND